MLNAWKPIQKQRMQSGQAIVLIALLVIGLLAFAGLAIDGGGLMLLKRDVQNATDAAILASTYAMCLDSQDEAAIEFAGLQAAAEDGFDDSGLTDEGGNEVEVNYPSSGGELDSNGNPLVEVKITARKPKYLIQLVYGGDLQITTRALGVCTPPVPAAVLEGAVSGTGAQGCQGTSAAVSIHGSNVVVIGGVFGNGNIKITSSGQDDNQVDGDVSSAGSADVQNAQHNGDTYQNQPVVAVPQFYNLADFRPGGKFAPGGAGDPDRNLPAVAASDYFYYNASNMAANVNGSGLTFTDNGGTVNFQTNVRGLIVVEGMKVNLATDNSFNPGMIHATFVGDQQIDVSLDLYIRFMAFWNNLAVFSEVQNSGLTEPGGCSSSAGESVSVTGKADFNGLIYAPKGGVSFSFSDGTYRGGIIARTVNISGSDMYMIHDPSYIPPVNPNIYNG